MPADSIAAAVLGVGLVFTIAACGGPTQDVQAPEQAPPAATATTETPTSPAPTPELPAAPTASAAPELALPEVFKGKAVVLAASDADFARANLAGAVKPAGEGGLARGLVVRLTVDVPVWRVWSGPAKKDARGNTNRIGQWWAGDAPRGSQQEYRAAYAICARWNDLTWVAKCSLKSGSVVAIGPGNSVSAATCGDAAGQEAYPVNEKDWQVYVSKARERLGADKELDCPDESADYEVDPADVAKKRATRPAKN